MSWEGDHSLTAVWRNGVFIEVTAVTLAEFFIGGLRRYFNNKYQIVSRERRRRLPASVQQELIREDAENGVSLRFKFGENTK
jgi:hypothetical protein